MKRSNRLILLIGLFLAVVAFVGVVMLLNQQSSTTTKPPEPTTAKIVVAAVDIPLGTTITTDMLTTKDVPVASKPTDSFELPGLLIGSIVRTDVKKDQIITPAAFDATTAVTELTNLIDPGLRAISVQVDQISGVGTLVKPGDTVDVVMAMEETDAKNPIVVEQAPTKTGSPPVTQRNFASIDELLNNTTVKVIVQNVKVLGTLLPEPTQPNNNQGGAQASPAPNTPSLNGQQQIVVLAVTPQQAEVIRFTQLDGNLSLLLRSPGDASAAPITTSGITLRQLVDKYGVLPPHIILTTQP